MKDSAISKMEWLSTVHRITMVYVPHMLYTLVFPKTLMNARYKQKDGGIPKTTSLFIILSTLTHKMSTCILK